MSEDSSHSFAPDKLHCKTQTPPFPLRTAGFVIFTLCTTMLDKLSPTDHTGFVFFTKIGEHRKNLESGEDQIFSAFNINFPPRSTCVLTCLRPTRTPTVRECLSFKTLHLGGRGWCCLCLAWGHWYKCSCIFHTCETDEEHMGQTRAASTDRQPTVAGVCRILQNHLYVSSSNWGGGRTWTYGIKE